MKEEKLIYDGMWENFEQVMKTEEYQNDELIDNPTDNRRGITTLSYLRNDTQLTNNISSFLSEIKDLEPEQYYPPISDLHVTILTIITCFEDFHLSDSEGQDYAEVFKEATRSVGPFELKFKGVTASPSCILLQGFMQNECLHELRNKLRAGFNKSKLHFGKDARYNIATAHSTVVRFKRPLNNANQLLELLEEYREYDFGTHNVNSVRLVTNDWYLKESNTKELARVMLAPQYQ